MGLKWEKELVEARALAGFECNRCGTEYTPDNVLEMQEMFRYGTTGGYGSVWGDGADIEIVLCQDCAHKLLGMYAEDVTEEEK